MSRKWYNYKTTINIIWKFLSKAVCPTCEGTGKIYEKYVLNVVVKKYKKLLKMLKLKYLKV